MRFFICQWLLLLIVGSTFARPIPNPGSSAISLYKRGPNDAKKDKGKGRDPSERGGGNGAGGSGDGKAGQDKKSLKDTLRKGANTVTNVLRMNKSPLFKDNENPRPVSDLNPAQIIHPFPANNVAGTSAQHADTFQVPAAAVGPMQAAARAASSRRDPVTAFLNQNYGLGEAQHQPVVAPQVPNPAPNAPPPPYTALPNPPNQNQNQNPPHQNQNPPNQTQNQNQNQHQH